MDLPAGRAMRQEKRFASRRWWISQDLRADRRGDLRRAVICCSEEAIAKSTGNQSAFKNIREAMDREHLDALIVCGNQYAGFEGAVFYVSGFEIVHRYVYVLIPLEGEPTLVFPREARWIGDKAKPWIKDQVWPTFLVSGSPSEAAKRLEARRRLRHEFRDGRSRLP